MIRNSAVRELTSLVRSVVICSLATTRICTGNRRHAVHAAMAIKMAVAARILSHFTTRYIAENGRGETQGFAYSRRPAAQANADSPLPAINRDGARGASGMRPSRAFTTQACATETGRSFR
mgnify:CR=1 FL=1